MCAPACLCGHFAHQAWRSRGKRGLTPDVSLAGRSRKPGRFARMDAVVLALTSAALFGLMTVALRFALVRVADAEVGALLTILTALAVTLPFAFAGDVDLTGIWPFLLAGVLGPGISQILFTLAIRDAGPSRTSVMVGTAPLFAVAIALTLLDEPANGGRDRRRAPDRRRRDRAGPRARPARAREVDRARVCALRGGRLRGARQHRPPPLARHRRRAGAGGRVDARRGRRDRLRLAAPHPPAVAHGTAYAPSFRRGSSSGSRTSACSRRTTAAVCRSSLRSSRPSRCGASASRRCCSEGASSSARGSPPAPCSSSPGEC